MGDQRHTAGEEGGGERERRAPENMARAHYRTIIEGVCNYRNSGLFVSVATEFHTRHERRRPLL
eukprot:scaffold218559_cov26-Tisochrysis_lutea.AAC.1